MDLPPLVEDVVAQAREACRTGREQRCLELLLPLVEPGARDRLSPQQERDVQEALAVCYRWKDYFNTVRPHAERLMELSRQLDGPRSRQRAVALVVLGMVHTWFTEYAEARKLLMEALAILDELGLQQDVEYGAALLWLGRLENWTKGSKEALVIFEKARAVLSQHKGTRVYGLLLDNKGYCHWILNQLNEALPLFVEAVDDARALLGNDHPDYAFRLSNLAGTFTELKRHEEAIPLLEEALAIQQRRLGLQHLHTVSTANALAAARKAVPRDWLVDYALAQGRLLVLSWSQEHLQAALNKAGAGRVLRLAVDADDGPLMEAVANLKYPDANALTDGLRDAFQHARAIGRLALLTSKAVLAAFHRRLRSAALLRLAVDADDGPLMEAVASLKGLDLNALVDSQQGALEYATANRRTHALAVLLRLRLQKTLRVLFVGREGAGKTQLRKDVQGRPYRRNTTLYLEIDKDWQVDGLQLSVWDFAGQPGYHAAQRLFLGEVHPEQLVVVLCVDVRTGHGEELRATLAEWLSGVCNAAATRDAKVTLVVVATHCDAVKEPHQAVGRMEADLKLALTAIEFAGRVALLHDGEHSVWMRRKDDAAFVQRLRARIVQHGLEGGNRLARTELHELLVRVHANQTSQGVTLLARLGEATPQLEQDLAELHGHGQLFYQRGAKAGCGDVTAPLQLFKALLRHQYVRCDAAEFVEVRPWYQRDVAVRLHIEHNELWDVGATQPRCTLRGATIIPESKEFLHVPDGQPAEFTLAPRDGSALRLRFTQSQAARDFVQCLQCNRLQEHAYTYVIEEAVVHNEANQMYKWQPDAHQLLVDMLLSNGVLARNPRLVPGDNTAQAVAMTYLMPYLFPSSSNVGGLNWHNFPIRHARRYVIALGATQSQMQGAVLALAGVMRGGAEVDHFWRDDADDTLSVGAWQHSSSHKTYFECRYDATVKQWSLYVLLAAAANRGAGLTKMIVDAHVALQEWHEATFGVRIQSYWVACHGDLATPEQIATKTIATESGMVLNSKVAKEDIPLLLPENMRDAHVLSDGDRTGAICVWCTSVSGPSQKVLCDHSWTVADHFVATAYLSRGGQGHVLAGHSIEDRQLRCAIKVQRRESCAWEVRAWQRLEDVVWPQARVVRVLGWSGATRTGSNADVQEALVMELLGGKTLEAADARYRDERFFCTRMLGPLCDALDRMHGRVVWHLDVKPANIMWSSAGDNAVLTLIDLAACAIDGAQKRAGERFEEHTPWIAPELRAGLAPTDTSDVYSVGMLAVQLLLGWDHGSLSRMRDRNQNILLVLQNGGVGDGLAGLLERMCDADPARRPKLAEVVQALPGLQRVPH